MGKRLNLPRIRSLTERLETALRFTETEEESDEIYALLDHIARRTLNTTAGEFYETLRQPQLEAGQYQGNGNIPKEEIETGKRLAEILQTKIQPLHPPKEDRGKRGYGHIHERARIVEFKLIRDFYKK